MVKKFAYSILSVFALAVALTTSGCGSSQLARDDQKITKVAGGAIVEVEFYESKIHMPTVIPKGHITFRVHNPSHFDHNLKITGNNIERRMDSNVQEGQTADFVLDMPSGTYSVMCPLLGHSDLGEKLQLTVTNE